MRTVDWERTRALRPDVLAVVIANGLPLAGVVALGWSAASLVVVYWFELAVMCLWTIVRALFAGRPSEFGPEPLLVGALADRPVAIPVPRTGLGIQLSSLPVLAVTVPLLAFVWFVVGTVTVGVVGDQVLEPDAISTIALAVFALFCAEGGRTSLEYFHRQGYREHSAQTAIQGVFWHSLVLFFVGLFGTALVATVDPSVAGDEPIADADSSIAGVVLLAGIVCVKFGFDLVGVYRDRLVAFDESTDIAPGWAYEPPTGDRVDTALSDDERRVCPPVPGRLLAGRSHAKRYPAAWFVAGVVSLIALLFATGGHWVTAAGLVAAGVFVSLLLVHVDYWLRYAGVEYRVDGNAIVAYDRLFRTPLWRVEAWDESGIIVERDRIDDWLGTSTVVVELSDRNLRLPRLREIDPVLEVFDRPPRER